jgi:hypothetical protein
VDQQGDGSAYGFTLVFAVTLAQIESAVRQLETALEAGDAKLWFAYPKGSSKRYKCEFNRDTGWQALGDAGFEPVRQIAIDEDWSALRFRRVQFIKNLTRASAISVQGKTRTARKPT